MRFAFDDSSDDSDEFDLDRDFPLGDGTADTSGAVTCPYCGEPNSVSLDPGSGDRQEYVEDCAVCCQPWRVTVEYGHDGHAAVRVQPLDQ
ncbi:MAG TPA: CPXCG motif-containing cysteine-rich protein [Gemmatimonadaceae bacterium]|jgi:cysteine-rich CPXCG protein|nr:CPXCG motif-containing cysteine-rich protein [Gemmatimonadaceae bacterium]HTJ22644.1 CPXCG motif-containing cysteine-rich protein [Gemmatimonadaceae bacterium]